jgi:hypothetical protein
MATTPNEVGQEEGGFRARVVSAVRTVSQHPRTRDTAIPALGVLGVVAGVTANAPLALGVSMLTFALLDKRR